MNLRWPTLGGILDLQRAGTEAPSLIVVGLGNPGPEYAETRHNVGFWCIDRLADKHSIAVAQRRRTAVLGEGSIGGKRVVLAKPRTFVNCSGRAAAYLLARYRISVSEILIVYDDAALPLGKVRLRPRGGSGGHRGIASVIETVETQEVPRLRIGIGQPPLGTDQAKYVLDVMPDAERTVVDAAIEEAVQAVATLLSEGMDSAMGRHN